MNKRLRKKRHLGEFNWKCFEVICTFDYDLTPTQIIEFLDEFIAFVESRNLELGGGVSARKMGQYISKAVPTKRRIRGEYCYKASHCTESDREAVASWLRSKAFVRNLVIGSLEGGWH